MTKMSFPRKVIFYLSNMLPTFIASMVIYVIPYRGATGADKIYFYFTLVMTLVSIAGLFSWARYLKSLGKKSDSMKEKGVRESNEITSVVSSYIIAYAVSVISVSAVGGIRGIILLAVLVVVLGLYAFGWNVMLFNPFLMLLGYRVYWMELDDGSTGYLILKHTGGPIKDMKKKLYPMIKIDDYLYYSSENS